MSIKFKCPRCGARHQRGYYMGQTDTFRCLGCGHVGQENAHPEASPCEASRSAQMVVKAHSPGFHPDPEIEAGVVDEILEAQAWNVAHGLPAGPFAP